MSLKARLIRRCIAATIVAAAMLFVPTGTFRWWEGWVYLAIIAIPMMAFSAYYYKHDPALVERRMRSKEKVKQQKIVMRLGSLITPLVLIVPGLDHRFGWSERFIGRVPLSVVAVAMAATLVSYLASMWVMDVNRFAGRTIEVEAEQRVVSSGPYALVRHPLYAAALVMMLCTPLALGSYVGLPFAALFIPVLVARLRNEEEVLRRELPGYTEYCQKTTYRLVPYLW
jgi:protein-S-isoprenylcysteine O-methyltransferase Ste14